MPRIAPLTSPFDDVAAEHLAAMTPPGSEPIALFRTFTRHPAMTAAMRPWGAYELGRALSIGRREREIVIDRTCARCGCEYEWSVHVAYFAEKVGFDRAQITSLAHGAATDGCWTDEREAVLLELVDQLHDTADVDDALWARLAAHYSDEQLLDVLLLTGWYHAISYAANGARVEHESGAPTFADYAPLPTDREAVDSE
jgi:alkylhydroperoxidase family enzyme